MGLTQNIKAHLHYERLQEPTKSEGGMLGYAEECGGREGRDSEVLTLGGGRGQSVRQSVIFSF